MEKTRTGKTELLFFMAAFAAAHLILGVGEYHIICREMERMAEFKILIVVVLVAVSAAFWYCNFKILSALPAVCPWESVSRILGSYETLFLWTGFGLGILIKLIFDLTDLYQGEAPNIWLVTLCYESSVVLHSIVNQILCKRLYQR